MLKKKKRYMTKSLLYFRIIQNENLSYLKHTIMVLELIWGWGVEVIFIMFTMPKTEKTRWSEEAQGWQVEGVPWNN